MNESMKSCLVDNVTCLAERVIELESLVENYANLLVASTHAQDTAWVIVCGALVFFMQLGFLMLEMGSVRDQSILGTSMKNLLDLVLGILAGVVIGYYLAYGVHPLNLSMRSADIEKRSFFFYSAFQSTAATIVSGAVAERCTNSSYAIMTVFMSGVLYALAVRLTWAHGWLHQLGYHDFAGGGIVHLFGGSAALAAAYVLGPRKGRWDPSKSQTFDPSSVPFIMCGVMILWFGWYGFNAGSTGLMSSDQDSQIASNAALITTIGGCTGGTVAALLAAGRLLRGSRGIDVIAITNGILSGLVGITAGCDVFEPRYAILVAAISVLFFEMGSAMCIKLQIDDVVNAFAVHGCSGICGVIAVGLFHYEKGLFIAGDVELLGYQATGGVILALLAGVPMFLLCLLLRRLGLYRLPDGSREDSIYAMSAFAQSDRVVQHLAMIDDILKRAGYTGTLIDALGAVETHANVMNESRIRRHSAISAAGSFVDRRRASACDRRRVSMKGRVNPNVSARPASPPHNLPDEEVADSERASDPRSHRSRPSGRDVAASDERNTREKRDPARRKFPLSLRPS